MLYGFGAPRYADTTLVCPECGSSLQIARTCHEVFMRCTQCEKKYDLKQFISKADNAMEKFLEAAYMDRI